MPKPVVQQVCSISRWVSQLNMLMHLNTLPKKPSRIVLLGGNGFIGQNLASILQDAQVDFLSLSSKDIDLCAPDSVPKIVDLLQITDTVVFLSAITPDKGRDADVFIKNLQMMKHFCSALKNKPVSHVIYFSSDAVYGLKQSNVSEDSPVAPADLYGVMHLSRELMLAEMKSISHIILRVTMVYGAGDTHASYGPNRFFKTAKQDQRIDLFGGGEELRDHVHVNDVAAITKLCAFMKTTGLLNIATGRSTSFKEVAELVTNQFQNKVNICESPRANSITHRHYDTINLLKAFPTFSLIKIEDGIETYQNRRNFSG
jgi:UDP-glucose 4-epimerase